MFRYIPVFFLVLLSSCASRLPKDVLPPDKMEMVLWDVAKGGEFANGYIYPKYPSISKATIDTKLLEEIFRAHGITKTQFNKSLDYYQKKPEMLLRVLDSAGVHAAERTELDKPPENKKQVADSVASSPEPAIQPVAPMIPAAVQ